MEKKFISILYNKLENRYSQNGEDGIIKYLLQRLGRTGQPNFFVEFGAWDGKLFSNTFAFLNKLATAIYIESDIFRFKKLQKLRSQANIIPINAFVSVDKNSYYSLDNILDRENFPKDFELLSIDVDSFDLEIWMSLEKYKPKIVIIEINSNFPPGIEFIHSNSGMGNSFTSTLNFGIANHYTLVAHTGNLIFVREDLMHLCSLGKNSEVNSPKLYLYRKTSFLKYALSILRVKFGINPNVWFRKDYF